jgi:hypothetical protein
MSDKHLATEADVKNDHLATHHEDLEYGDAGPRVRNPLRGIPKHELYQGVEAFTQEHNLQEYTEVFKRGALVAQKPLGYNSLSELSSEEKEALQYEQDHKWSGPWPLYFTGRLSRSSVRLS